jgi:hypothetical protein
MCKDSEGPGCRRAEGQSAPKPASFPAPPPPSPNEAQDGMASMHALLVPAPQPLVCQTTHTMAPGSRCAANSTHLVEARGFDATCDRFRASPVYSVNEHR